MKHGVKYLLSVLKIGKDLTASLSTSNGVVGDKFRGIGVKLTYTELQVEELSDLFNRKRLSDLRFTSPSACIPPTYIIYIKNNNKLSS